MRIQLRALLLVGMCVLSSCHVVYAADASKHTRVLSAVKAPFTNVNWDTTVVFQADDETTNYPISRLAAVNTSLLLQDVLADSPAGEEAIIPLCNVDAETLPLLITFMEHHARETNIAIPRPLPHYHLQKVISAWDWEFIAPHLAKDANGHYTMLTKLFLASNFLNCPKLKSLCAASIAHILMMKPRVEKLEMYFPPVGKGAQLINADLMGDVLSFLPGTTMSQLCPLEKSAENFDSFALHLHTLVQEARCTSRESLVLNDGSCVFWWEAADKRNKIGIKQFNDFNFLSHQLPQEAFNSLLGDDVSLALQENREPVYIADLLALKKQVIAEFIAQVEQSENSEQWTRNQWVRHLYSVFFTFIVNELRMWELVNKTCRQDASEKIYTTLSSAYLRYISEMLIAIEHFRFSAEKKNALKNAIRMARQAKVDDVVTEAFHAAQNTFEAHKPGSMSSLFFSKQRTATTTLQARVRAYREVEKIYLLNFLKLAQDPRAENNVLQLSYQGGYTALPESLENNTTTIFASIDRWKAFKHKHFAKILASADTRGFILPWLEDIDRIVEIIAAMPEEAAQ